MELIAKFPYTNKRSLGSVLIKDKINSIYKLYVKGKKIAVINKLEKKAHH